MTANYKFEARLRELGLWERWCDNGMCGRIGAHTDDGTIILVHENYEDEYTEYRYPPFKQMSESSEFRNKALAEFADAGDEKFIRQLVWWWINPINPCPLFPEDAHFLWNEYTWENFEDDEEDEPKSETGSWNFGDGKTEEWCPHCDEAVELEHELKVQKCPICGKWIVPCSVCPLTDCSTKCPLERMAIILNKE